MSVKSLPSYCPYRVGVKLTLEYFPRGANSSEDYSPVMAVIEKAFTPFTKSQVLLVRFLHSYPNLPPVAVRKLYDRRFVNDRDEMNHPWLPHLERAVVERSCAVAAGEVAQNDWDSVDEDEWDDGHYEAHFQSLVDWYFDSETNAYERLKSLQGHYIPRFFGVIRFKYEVDSVPGHQQAVAGVILEYLAGLTLEDMQHPEALRSCPELARTLLAAVDSFRKKGVVHHDIREANVMLVNSDGSKRLVVFDFGKAAIRQADESDVSWNDRAALHDIRELSDILNTLGIRDQLPGWSGRSPNAAWGFWREELARDTERHRIERFWEKMPVEDVPQKLLDTAARSKHEFEWFRMKPEVYRWMKGRDVDDPRYWFLPRPGSPE